MRRGRRWRRGGWESRLRARMGRRSARGEHQHAAQEARRRGHAAPRPPEQGGCALRSRASERRLAPNGARGELLCPLEAVGRTGRATPSLSLARLRQPPPLPCASECRERRAELLSVRREHDDGRRGRQRARRAVVVARDARAATALSLSRRRSAPAVPTTREDRVRRVAGSGPNHANYILQELEFGNRRRSSPHRARRERRLHSTYCSAR